MELKDYLAILRKRWISIVIITLLVLTAVSAYTYLQTPQYRSSNEVFVSMHSSSESTGEMLQGGNFVRQRIASYASIAKTPVVLDPVIDELGLERTAAQLASAVSVTAGSDTVMLTIAVTDPDPELAANIANAVAASLAVWVSENEPQTPEGEPTVVLSSVTPATVPASATSPNVTRNVALGLFLGVLLGIGFAVLREVLDTTVRTRKDIANITGVASLGAIEHDPEAVRKPLVVHADPQSRRAELFRQLRTNLQFVDAANSRKSIVITSSLPGEGKSTTSANLAITMAAAGMRVCLIEGDLRRPKVGEYLGLEDGIGVTTVLIGKASLEEVIQPWGNGNLHVLLAGQIPPNPSELLGSTAMKNIIQRLEQSYDMVIIDAPPLVPVTDGAILAANTGGAVLIVRANHISRDDLTVATEALKSVNAKMLGTVMTHAPATAQSRYGYYGFTEKELAEQQNRSRKNQKAGTTNRRAMRSS